jgi:hypothetical protein
MMLGETDETGKISRKKNKPQKNSIKPVIRTK